MYGWQNIRFAKCLAIRYVWVKKWSDGKRSGGSKSSCQMSVNPTKCNQVQLSAIKCKQVQPESNLTQLERNL